MLYPYTDTPKKYSQDIYPLYRSVDAIQKIIKKYIFYLIILRYGL